MTQPVPTQLDRIETLAKSAVALLGQVVLHLRAITAEELAIMSQDQSEADALATQIDTDNQAILTAEQAQSTAVAAVLAEIQTLENQPAGTPIDWTGLKAKVSALDSQVASVQAGEQSVAGLETPAPPAPPVTG